MPTTFEAVRAEALFASTLQGSQQPAPSMVRDAVASSLRAMGIRGCAAAVAVEFGDHPEVAVRRMAWALATVRAVYPPRGRDVTCRVLRPMPRPMALAS